MKWVICLFRGHVWKFHDEPIGTVDCKSVAVRFWSECEKCKAKKDDRVVSLDRYFKR